MIFVESYKGWQIYLFNHAKSNWFTCYRFGVNMNTNTISSLKLMIDNKKPWWEK